MKLEFAAYMPIPIGHRVALRWYYVKSSSIFAEDEKHPDEPVIEDLDTGIVYAVDWLFERADADDATTVTAQLKKGFREERSMVGRISACRIIRITQIRNSAGDNVRTELTIEPEEAPTAAYR
jgi:hypothetical protein